MRCAPDQGALCQRVRGSVDGLRFVWPRGRAVALRATAWWLAAPAVVLSRVGHPAVALETNAPLAPGASAQPRAYGLRSAPTLPAKPGHCTPVANRIPRPA